MFGNEYPGERDEPRNSRERHDLLITLITASWCLCDRLITLGADANVNLPSSLMEDAQALKSMLSGAGFSVLCLSREELDALVRPTGDTQ